MIADNQDEAWCIANFLSHAALRLAVVIRAELLEVMQRIELPVSPPAFGCQDNCTNIKRALISGFFLKVSILVPIHTVFSEFSTLFMFGVSKFKRFLFHVTVLNASCHNLLLY